jgi:hypothetical protein
VLASPLTRARLRRTGERSLRVLRMPPRELLTTLHVVIVLTVVELSIRWVSLPRLCRLLGLHVNLAAARADAERLRPTELSPRESRQLRCAHRVADAWPFSRGPCLRRSLVVGHLLREHRPAVRLGVAGVGDEVLAHAWVEIDDRPLEDVSGYSVFHQANERR